MAGQQRDVGQAMWRGCESRSSVGAESERAVGVATARRIGRALYVGSWHAAPRLASGAASVLHKTREKRGPLALRSELATATRDASPRPPRPRTGGVALTPRSPRGHPGKEQRVQAQPLDRTQDGVSGGDFPAVRTFSRVPPTRTN